MRSEADVAVLRLAARVGQIRRGELGRGARGGGSLVVTSDHVYCHYMGSVTSEHVYCHYMGSVTSEHVYCHHMGSVTERGAGGGLLLRKHIRNGSHMYPPVLPPFFIHLSYCFVVIYLASGPDPAGSLGSPPYLQLVTLLLAVASALAPPPTLNKILVASGMPIPLLPSPCPLLAPFYPLAPPPPLVLFRSVEETSRSENRSSSLKK